MKADLIAAEIGSTTTVVSAFNLGLTQKKTLSPPRLLGQGSAATTVLQGDVRIGLAGAVADLICNMSGNGMTPDPGEIAAAFETDRREAAGLSWQTFTAASSAAGGLRMSVHGLVMDMTAKAAKEAALGAGANITGLTAGAMETGDLERLAESAPNIIMIAGGVDYGERNVVRKNAELILNTLADRELKVPVIYAGNIQNRQAVQNLAERRGVPLYICPNVYPAIDKLNVEPARNIIQRVFEEHIVKAPGMGHVRDLVDGAILPVPGAVMKSAKHLKEVLGDLVVFDIGGATTDLHSVCSDTPEIGKILTAPEPEAKRTVEGDLGVFINRASLVLQMGHGRAAEMLGVSHTRLSELLAALPGIPETDEQRALVSVLTRGAAALALQRHAGKFRELYTISGRQVVAEGKDLTGIQFVIGTGGALTRITGGRELLTNVLTENRNRGLLPPPEAEVLLDTNYIMATIGMFIDTYPDAGIKLLQDSLHVTGDSP